ncbi:hypothetical protein HG535_0D05910 [Zygotorulaspora mrakii]|uniref:Uncharacterized protein n=1 Tax=Zygotorulaspora mrakii TaxID=42260 RepID=A0A7H9B543_ZYGMR|nr:uncharacterized protein HG535_0D05910 [Zygotorulaspora mrakii]QLG72882.1 hypothetical protein HG535_0D05910 [Zygotorulaspora mrakii]
MGRAAESRRGGPGSRMDGGSNVDERRPTAPLMTILRSRIRQPQFYWFLGHFMACYHFVRFYLSLFSVVGQKYHYTRVLFYISVTYAIVLYQFYKSGQLEMGKLVRQLQKLDNLQYFCVSTLLYMCSLNNAMVNGALNSPIIFSFFHTLNYFKENLLPFLPVKPILRMAIKTNIGNFIGSYNGYCLRTAQVFEIICGARSGLIDLPLTLVKLILFGFHTERLFTLCALLTYVWFFKLRYNQCESIRVMLQQFVHLADTTVHSKFPPSIGEKWQMLKNVVIILFSKIPA